MEHRARSTAPRHEPIAIIGTACRLPGGITDLGGLWTALAEERDLISPAPPADRVDAARFLDPDLERPGKAYTMAGGYLGDISGFDPEYFGISPREAKHMDPQQRLLLEMAAEAFDDAAVDPARLAGSDTAVFVGISDMSYGLLQMARLEEISAYSMSGSTLSVAANRLSYVYDLRGPSMAVDTACSSSLVALHQACETLRSGRSRVAVAGGMHLLLGPHHYIGFSRAMMLSPRGRCATFSAEADGYARAEGGGLVVLKRLADALADGDRVHAVITASGANCDGSTSGMTVPSTEMQQRLLRDVYAEAGASADQVLYFEAHGTGTPIGDPLECQAVGNALGTRRTNGPLPIGSVKTNLGHTEPASGMAGLFKGMLVLRHGRVPASLHGDPPNPQIDFEGLNLSLVDGMRPLGAVEGGVVGVNSFGFGGANAHVVLGPAPRPAPAAGNGRPPGPLPLVVSARTRQALAATARSVAGRLHEVEDDQEFYDLCWTASRRRARHPHRATVLAHGPRDAAARLAALAGDDKELAAAAAQVDRVPDGGLLFVFCGNGSQWAGMGAALMAQEPVFRGAVEEADAHLRPLLGWSVAELLAAGPEETADRMAGTGCAQPALFAFQLGLVALLAEYGVRPAAVLGHSVGEVAAAYVSGALELPDAARVVAGRSRAQEPTAGAGRMAAVGLAEQEAVEAIAAYDGRLEIAAVNSPRDVTVSGRTEALRELGRELAAREVPFRELDVDHGFHSAVMDVIEEPLRAALSGLVSRAPRLPMYSTVTGGPVEAGQLDADYWWRSARRPVRFADAVGAAAEAGLAAAVEIAPQPSVAGPLNRIAADARGGAFPVFSPVGREKCTGQAVREAALRLLAVDSGSDWERWFPRAGSVADLPAYPWQRERHWQGTPEHWVRTSGDGVLVHSLLGERAPVLEPTWHTPVERTRTPWLADHRVAGSVVMPATAYVELALAAGQQVFGGPVELDDLEITRALPLSWDTAMDVRLQTSLCDEDGIVRVASRTGDSGGWRLHARGRVRRQATGQPEPVDLPGVRERTFWDVAGEDHYTSLAEAGLAYGPAFRVLRELRVGDAEVLASYHCAPADDGYGGYVVHPALLDGALQAGAPLIADAESGYLPSGIDRLRQWGTPAEDGLVHVRQRSRTPRSVVWDITVTDEDGTVTLELTGCRLQRLSLPVADRGEEFVTALRAAPLPGQPVPAWVPPSPGEIVAAAEEALTRLREGPAAEFLAVPVTTVLKRFTAHTAAAAFEELLPGRDAFTLDDLLAAGMLPRHEKLVRLLARMAEEHGLLASDGEGWRRLAEGRPSLALSQASGLAGYLAPAALNLRFALHLPALLTGRRDPLELLFQDSGPELIQQFYDLSPLTSFHNRMLGELLRALLDAWPADRPLRVLEVGAGTGGLAAHLLPLLDDRVQYVFSDVSAAFFPPAQARFEAYHHRLAYRTFDLDTEPARQGLTEGSFDVVVAGLALHTAADLKAGLRRLAPLLAPGGHLLAVEFHDPQVLALMFGTLENFWSDRDPLLRPESVVLPRAQWPAVLAESGFEETVRLGCGVEVLEEQFSVLAARTPVAGGARERVPESVAAAEEARTVPEPGAAEQESTPAEEDGPVSGRGPERPVPASWTIVVEDEEESALATALAERLAASGKTTDVVSVPDGDDAWRELLGQRPEAAVVLLLGDSLDRAADRDSTARTEAAVRRAATLRALARAHRARSDESRHFVLVTHPTGALPAPERPAFPGQAAAWGVARTLANESSMNVRRVSLDRGPDLAGDAARLAHEFLAVPPGDPLEEDEVVLTRGGRFVPRVERPCPATETVEPGGPVHYQLRVANQGLGFGLEWAEAATLPPGPGEVVITVRAAALNYRDVMVATGLLPPMAEDGLPSEDFLGLEGAGTVCAVGEGVEHLAVGDRVFGLIPGAFASHARLPALAVRPIPEGMTFGEAATLPVAFFTVQHSLEHLARLRPGETVLVHGAVGGVGLAALQYARHVGARFFATAGSPAKRDLVTQAGVELVLDSRSHDFADQVRLHTGGRGVDVVLNSLSGEAAARSRELLAPGGRFIELGKRDIYGNQRMLQKPLSENATHCVVDAARLVFQAPEHAEAVFDEVIAHVRAGDYAPLAYTAYPAHRIEEAFRLMQHSKHIGKLVVTFDDPVPVRRTPPPLRIHADGTYLVTGGLGGFGAETARWLAEQGARHLTLVSRRGEQAPEAAELLAELRAGGVDVQAHALDIADPGAVRPLIEALAESGRPVRGIVHSAMHLDDDALTELTDERLRAVLAPKWGGAALLDSLCPRADLVLYSSASALGGTFNQAAYVAANLASEALVRARRAAGRPGLAVAWGAIGRVGYVARNDLTSTLSAAGLLPVEPRDALTALGRFTGEGREQVVFGRCDWGRLSVLAHSVVNRPRFVSLVSTEAEGTGLRWEDLLGKLAGMPPAEAATAVEDMITQMVAETLHMPQEEVDRHRPLQQYGMDSLMGMEMLTKFRTHLNQEVPVMELLHSDGSIHGITETVLPHLLKQARSGEPADLPSTLPAELPGTLPAELRARLSAALPSRPTPR
ncbi:SDR family NAD(P)-dependent oxidoreductase [Streptomyces sp. NPDC020379]|uniref:SDR family NAD(P)-dependent oxidoreductase n=1 Tax=Streptomyces sp. NPDC020379 TaxID=3365071 RepID=UPI00379433C8